MDFKLILYWPSPTSSKVDVYEFMPDNADNDQSRGEAINSLSSPQIVGWNIDADLAYIWQNLGSSTSWCVKDLNALTVCLDGAELLQAHDINDSGWIIAYGDDNGDAGGVVPHAYLLIPFEACIEGDIAGPGGDCPDSCVDFADFTALNANLGDPGCNGNEPCLADLDCDGDVDFDDYTALLSEYNNCCSGSSEGGLAPELTALWGAAGGEEALATGSISPSALDECMEEPCQTTRLNALMGLLE